MGINIHTFTGRIGRDAETRFTQGGKAVTSFPVAVDVGYGDSKQTLWVDCVIWGERGEKIAAYLTKGGIVTVSGEPSLNTYDSKDGPRTKLVNRVNDVQLPPRVSEGAERPARAQERPPAQTAAPSQFDDDDIPF